MKVDRIIFCYDGNPLFENFWNLFSEVFKQKWNVIPTLVTYGEVQSNLSNKYGDIINIPTVEFLPRYERNWAVTWCLFCGATQFEDEVCMTLGLDQLILNNRFFNSIKHIDDDKYVVGISDGYGSTELFPSAYHVAKGSVFKDVLSIDDDIQKEFEKVFSNRFKSEFVDKNDFWGLDETYSSSILKNHKSVIKLDSFKKIIKPTRLCRSNSLYYEKEKLVSGYYSELHSPRPYYIHKNYIDKIIQDLLE